MNRKKEMAHETAAFYLTVAIIGSLIGCISPGAADPNSRRRI